MTIEQIIRTVPIAFIWSIQGAIVLIIALLLIVIGLYVTNRKETGK